MIIDRRSLARTLLREDTVRLTKEGLTEREDNGCIKPGLPYLFLEVMPYLMLENIVSGQEQMTRLGHFFQSNLVVHWRATCNDH